MEVSSTGWRFIMRQPSETPTIACSSGQQRLALKRVAQTGEDTTSRLVPVLLQLLHKTRPREMFNWMMP